MGQRAEALASDFEAAAKEFEGTVKQIPADKWNTDCDGGWTVGQVAEHVAGQFPLEMEFITAAAEGQPLPGYGWDDINTRNDGRAAQNKGMSRDQVLATLDQHVPSVAAYIRGLDDSKLDDKSALPLADGAEVTTEQILQGGILIDHVRGHLKSIRAVI
jgi:hypothetical protein